MPSNPHHQNQQVKTNQPTNENENNSSADKHHFHGTLSQTQQMPAKM
jgi:hypothetical protein